jgi:hypothetical protein
MSVEDDYHDEESHRLASRALANIAELIVLKWARNSRPSSFEIDSKYLEMIDHILPEINY